MVFATIKKTGEPRDDETVCQSYEEKAKQELQFSDQIIYGDLLRFYDRNNPDHSPSKKEDETKLKKAS